MKQIIKRHIILLFFMICSLPAWNANHPSYVGNEEKLDVKEIIFDHICDSYEWHITSYGNHHISIPLPVILYSQESGWHIFLSSRLAHGQEYENFFIAEGGESDGKIVERTSDGNIKRPLDFSLTKIAAGIIINSLLLVVIVLYVSRWYKRKKVSDKAPKGFVGIMEMFIMMVNDDIIKPSIGKDYWKYSPYLLTAFFFIFLSNIMGLLPVFPGGANVTGNIAITLFLALCTFVAVNIFGTREYWREILWPDVPVWMKAPIPLMPVIEIFGLFTKPFALTVRLLANIMAGHSVILALCCIIFITHSMGPLLNGSMTLVAVLFSIFMNCLELLVAFIQAYVFTMLSAVFIGMSRVEPHKHKE